MNFIKKIFEKQVDEKVHAKFVRYSLGEFEKEPFVIKAGGKIQIAAGFEYLDVMYELVAGLVTEEVELNGVIVSKENIVEELASLNIEPAKITGKKYTIKTVVPPDTFKGFVERFNKYSLLINVKSGDYVVSSGKSVPKPGKLVEGFVKAKFPKSDLDLIKNEFLFDDEGDFKVASIKHTYVITDVKIDDKLVEEDPLKARLAAVRVGKIVRERNIDGKVSTSEADMKV